jgi:hypothetical protein
VRLAALAALVLAAVLGTAAPALSGPPPAGVLVPGRSLGGLELGATKAQVERRWGRAYGRCPRCVRERWYFNLYAFQPRGAAVEFENGRVTAIFTVYQPLGWRTRDGFGLGDRISSVPRKYGPLRRVECRGYHALVLSRRGSTTAFYSLGGRLWAFALQREDVPVCR